MDFQEFVLRFMDFEEAAGLFSWEIGGVYIWPYIRVVCMMDYWYFAGKEKRTAAVLLPPNYNGPLSIKDKYEKYIRRNIRFAHQRDVLLVSHQRMVEEDGVFRDIYTDAIDRNINRSHYVLDRYAESGSYIRKKSHNIIVDDLEQSIRYLKLKFDWQYVDKEDFKKSLIRQFEDFYSISLPISLKRRWFSVICQSLAYRQVLTRHYGYIVEKIRPKCIIISNAFSLNNQVLCEVAKKEGIPTAELQHGITRFHIAYNYKIKRRIECFPDYFLCWGQFDICNSKWPIDQDRIIPVGFPELEENRKKYQDINENKEKDIILIVSGGDYVDEIIDFTFLLYQLLDKNRFQIVYKMHPMECNAKDSSIYNPLNGSGVEVVSSYVQPIHYYISKADWVVGIGSSALYEATAFSKKIAVLDMKGKELSKPLYETGNALLVNKPEELANHIIRDDFRPKSLDDYFESDSISRINSAIERIITERH